MAESTLSLGYPDFVREVALLLGYSQTAGSRTATQTAEIDRLIQSGVRQFYHPPIVPGEAAPHEWSFLTPVKTLVTAADDYDYLLDDDFGGIIGPMTFGVTEGYVPVRVIGEGRIRFLRMRGTVTGKPKFVAIRPRESNMATGQRFEALFWPTPNAIFNLTYKCNALQNKISVSYPYPLGGMAHGETVMESCLAIAEERMDDVGEGTHKAKFLERLAASVSIDRKANSPEYFGYNADRSGIDQGNLPKHDYVTYDGTLYP